MLLALVLLAPQLLHLKTIGDAYVESRLARMDMISKVEESENVYKTIPAILHNNSGIMDAKVDPEDYQMVIDHAPVWRVTTNGYARATKKVDGKFKMLYMHTLVFGDRARHVNGDRLDNRRQNLVAVTKKKRKLQDSLEQEPDPSSSFKISKPSVISEECIEFQHDESTLPHHSGYAIIHYRRGKHYSGVIRNGIPHGFGVLYEQENQQQSMGMWIDGKLSVGMVLHFRPIPTCLCQAEIPCPFRVVDGVEVVKGGFRVI